jgi:hypothetical protein
LVTFRGRFCKKVIRSPRCRASGAAEWELGRESSRGKVLCAIVKYWYRILFMERDELLKCCHEWQTGNMKHGNWAISLWSERLNGLGCSW